MTRAIVNLALPVIEKKVATALANASTHAINSPGPTGALQEKLVAYVVRRMPTFYVTTDQTQSCSTENPVSCFSPAQQHEMDQLIFEGLQHLMARRSSWEMAAQDSSGGLGPSPSHWFG